MRVLTSYKALVQQTPAILAAGAVAVCVVALGAQQPTPTPLLDGRGLPLPFGVQPYYKPDFPLGSGPYKAIMSVEKGLSAHVAYYPADLAKLGNKKLPVLIGGMARVCMRATATARS